MEGRGYWRVGQFVHGLLHRINIFNNTVIERPAEGGGEKVLEGTVEQFVHGPSGSSFCTEHGAETNCRNAHL